MAERRIILRCVYCQKETKLMLKELRPMATQSQPITIVKYCAHCNRANKLKVLDNLDPQPWYLFIEETKGFLGYNQDRLPILQGEQDV